jgi:RNA polymerase sigma-70 factor (ECF subfamily)
VSTLADDALLSGIAAGDRDAAVAFVRRFQRRVYGLALAVTSDAGSADDVSQEAFLRAWRAAPTFDARRGSVATWLLTITRNVAIDTLRMRRAMPADPATLVNLLPTSTIGIPGEPSLTGRDVEQIRAAVVALPEPQRRAIVLSAIAGLTAAEVAEAEGIPLGTAKTRIRAAMQRLRAELAGIDDRAGVEEQA